MSSEPPRPLFLTIRRLVLNLFAATGALAVVVTFSPAVLWYGRILAGPWNDPPGKTLVVLGADMIEPRLIGINSYWRTASALAAYRQDRFERVVLSGAGAAEAMAGVLRAEGVPAEALCLETASQSTRENAMAVRPLLAKLPEPVVLMTSDYHMFRAHRVFSRLGLKVLPRPVPDVLKRAQRFPQRWGIFIEELVETVKIGYYYARGWL